MSRARARSPKPVSASTVDASPSERDVDRDPRPHLSKSAAPREADGFLVWDLVDEWGAQSFPASDPPANW
jgi:hypothetical protein